MDLLTAEHARDVELADLDLFDPTRFETAWDNSSPHAAWRALRTKAPLWESRTRDGVRIWSVTRFADVVRVLRNTRRFSSEYGTILDVRHGDPAGGRTINLMDPPRHRAVRLPTSRAMTTHALRALSKQIDANVERIIAPLCEPGVHDGAEVFLSLAMAAMGPIIGVAPELWAMIARAAMAGVAPEDPVYAAGGVRETLHTAHVELFTFLRGMLTERRRRPGDDLVSLLLAVEIDGQRLTNDEILLHCYSFLMGANTTTPHVASQLLHVLAVRPGLVSDLGSGAVRTATVIEEALRWSSPTNHLTRRTTEPVIIRSTTIEPGELVCAWVASANRDAEVFPDPDEFVPTRRPNPHIAFGVGAHICVGALSARMVLRLAVDKLVSRITGLELAGPVRHLRSNFINGITTLPVEVRT